MTTPDPQIITVRYTNYRGETAERRIVPERIWFGSTKWHPEPQWLMDVIDVDRNAARTFALRDMHVGIHPSITPEMLRYGVKRIKSHDYECPARPRWGESSSGDCTCFDPFMYIVNEPEDTDD